MLLVDSTSKRDTRNTPATTVLYHRYDPELASMHGSVASQEPLIFTDRQLVRQGVSPSGSTDRRWAVRSVMLSCVKLSAKAFAEGTAQDSLHNTSLKTCRQLGGLNLLALLHLQHKPSQQQRPPGSLASLVTRHNKHVPLFPQGFKQDMGQHHMASWSIASADSSCEDKGNR